jgi:hypothetical protein
MASVHGVALVPLAPMIAMVEAIIIPHNQPRPVGRDSPEIFIWHSLRFCNVGVGLDQADLAPWSASVRAAPTEAQSGLQIVGALAVGSASTSASVKSFMVAIV